MSGLDNEAMFSGRVFHNLMVRGSAAELNVKVSPYRRVKHIVMQSFGRSRWDTEMK